MQADNRLRKALKDLLAFARLMLTHANVDLGIEVQKQILLKRIVVKSCSSNTTLIPCSKCNMLVSFRFICCCNPGSTRHALVSEILASLVKNSLGCPGL